MTPDTAARLSSMQAPLQRQQAFSLVELLVVLAICGILASIAYPSYAEHGRRARRLEGKVALLEMMQLQERLYTRTNRYAAFSADAMGADQDGFRWWSAARAADSAYELLARPCEQAGLALCVELVAMPGTGKVDARFRDPECGALILVSTGEQRAEGPGRGCWP